MPSCPAPPHAPCRSAPRSSSRSPSSTPPIAQPSWPISGFANPASIASSGRATTCWDTSRSSPSAKTNAGPGRFRVRHPQCWPLERFTAISRAGSFGPKSCGYDQLLARGSLAACRDHGELRLEGKEYVVKDGDVINFRHATYESPDTREDDPRLRGAGAVRAGGRRDPGARAVRELKQRGHRAELVSIPFKWYPERRDSSPRCGLASPRLEREQWPPG